MVVPGAFIRYRLHESCSDQKRRDQRGIRAEVRASIIDAYTQAL